MEDGIVRVLPALICKAAVRLPVVFDEAITVAITVRVDPAQRRFDARPDLRESRAVPGALEVHSGEHHEERSRIDRAVVAAERHLAQVGHLAMASLMQDLAGLGVGARVKIGRLRGASVRSTPRATEGSDHSRNIAVMIPSRPKIVLNHGIPAYG